MTAAIHLDDRNCIAYLRDAGQLAPDEAASVEPAGDGNINWVRRVRTADRSLIVKQARAALERFPQYHAPTDRILCEARFYERARPLDPERVCPVVLAFDPTARVLVLEDLGDVPRLDTALERGIEAADAAARLARFLAAVHTATADDPSIASRFENEGMQVLHGDHIFDLPFRTNEFPLPPQVRARAEAIWREGRLAAAGDAAYAEYRKPRALVHGDAQAGNVLLATRGAVLLDAEIAHIGDPAFDLGTLLAHLWLPAVARGALQQADAAIAAARGAYDRAAGEADAELHARSLRYAAFEMLRRTLGAARMPAVADAGASLRVVDFATALL